MPDVPSTASYAIDAGGRIAWVDDGFARLARLHGVPHLVEGAPGRPLADFVAGERPRALQQSLIDRTRAGEASRDLRYRCDSPDMRRHAILRLDARPDGGVVFTTWFEEVEERPYQALFDRRRHHGPDSGVVRLCAWCNRVDLDGWREAEGGDVDQPPRVEHTVCDICELLLATRPAAGPTRCGPCGPA